jgi:RNA polymerase sigma-70 factor (ECF subfamily)
LLDEQHSLTVIHGLRDGCRDAWTALYRGYSGDIWRYVARLLGPESPEIGDVVQETFLAAARSARTFDSTRGTLWSWLTGIAHRQVALAARRNHRATRVLQLAESGMLNIPWLGDGSEIPDAVWERRELTEIVRWTLAELSPEYAALLAGKYLDEHSLETLSEQWGSTVDAIKSKLARARREFRELFQRVTRSSFTAADP